MIGKTMGKQEVNAGLVLALSGALMVLTAKGDGPLSLGRVVGGVLPNPVPRRGASTRGDACVPDQARQIAA